MSFCCCLLQGGSFVNTSTFKLWKFTWGCQGQRRSCFCGKLKGFWLQFSICRDAYNLIIQLLNSMPRAKILGKWDLKKENICDWVFGFHLFLVSCRWWLLKPAWKNIDLYKISRIKLSLCGKNNMFQHRDSLQHRRTFKWFSTDDKN